MCSAVSDCPTRWTVACQAPLTIEFPSQEYLSGLSFPSPGDLPDPGIESIFLTSSALAGRFFTAVPPGKPTLLGLTSASGGVTAALVFSYLAALIFDPKMKR